MKEKDAQILQSILSDVDNQINGLQGALSAINQFQDTLNGLHHLFDIDALWNELQNHLASYKDFHDACIDYKNKAEANTSTINSSIKEISEFRSNLESQLHIYDIDVIWDDTHEHYNRYGEFCKSYEEYKAQVDQFTKSLESQVFRLNGYREVLESYGHLKDVDEIWSDLQHQKSETESQKQSVNSLSDVFRRSVDELSDQIKSVNSKVIQYSEENDSTIANIRDEVKSLADKVNAINGRIDSEYVKMSHRVRVNHIIATLSAVLVIILFVLYILKVI